MDEDKVRKTLLALRDTLLQSSAETTEDRRPVELDQQSVGRLSRMDAMQVQAMAQAQEGRRQAQLRRIDGALERLAAGEYGLCVECGEDIPPKRLEIDPTVTRCVDCAGSA